MGHVLTISLFLEQRLLVQVVSPSHSLCLSISSSIFSFFVAYTGGVGFVAVAMAVRGQWVEMCAMSQWVSNLLNLQVLF